jgi:hypothetical protein
MARFCDFMRVLILKHFIRVRSSILHSLMGGGLTKDSKDYVTASVV